MYKSIKVTIKIAALFILLFNTISSFCSTNNTEGTILFKEDFGGNSPSDPIAKPTGISQCKYDYDTCPLDYSYHGRYAIRKVGYQPHYEWYTPIDHTYPDDKTRGYFMQCDASMDTCTFYHTQIDNLCENMQLYLSMWAMSCTQLAGYEDAYMKLVVEDLNGHELASKSIRIENCKGYWEQFGLNFTVPAGSSSIIYKLVNNATIAKGNDFCLDDIEVRLCSQVPQITEENSQICVGRSATLKATFENNGLYEEPVTYTWFKSKVNSYDADNWEKIQSSQNLVFDKVKASDSVYYRVMVSGKDGTTDLNNCSPISDIYKLDVSLCPYDTTILASICSGDVYSQDGFNEDSSGIYTHKLKTIEGADSIVTLKLTVVSSFKDTINARICEGETYNEYNFTEKEAGIYEHNYVSKTGCDSIVTLILEVNASPVIEKIQPTGDDYKIIYTEDSKYSPYTLCVDDDCEAGNIINGSDVGTHKILLTNNFGCEASQTFTVEEDTSINIGSIEPMPFFSPNGDGIFERWQIKNIEKLPDAIVNIFDRWGKLIVTISPYDNKVNAWDGTYNGHKMPSADYWYTISIDSIDQVYKGHFTLIR